MICELCGAEVPRTKNVAIESTVLSVCASCAKFGDEVMTPVVRRTSMPPVIAQRLEARSRRLTPRDVYAQGGEEELADDFSARIRRAREERGWKQADLGAKINEKVSVIAKLESSTITPGDALVRKLERELGIRLKERVQPIAAKKQSASAALTLGDLVKMQGESR
ncbi:MAG: TIGR00270 family protein [Euryarchaeota archaeon RBG_16_67_27]|nr:MAG: TIGR00270 family protein [Euryarchaeota archaeon RBG_16_67_27]